MCLEGIFCLSFRVVFRFVYVYLEDLLGVSWVFILR